MSAWLRWQVFNSRSVTIYPTNSLRIYREVICTSKSVVFTLNRKFSSIVFINSIDPCTETTYGYPYGKRKLVSNMAVKCVWKYKPIFFVLLLVFCQVFTLVGTNDVHAATSQLSKVKVDSLVRNGCYEWKDEDVSSQDSGIPMPPAFYARIASKVSCNELHHFQVISIDNREKFSKGTTVSGSSKKYCEQKLKASKLSLAEGRYLNWGTMEVSKKTLSYSCFVTGKVSTKPGSKKVYFFEELFSPLGKK